MCGRQEKNFAGGEDLKFIVSYYLYCWVTWCKLPLQTHFLSSKEAKVHRGRIRILPVCSNNERV